MQLEWRDEAEADFFEILSYIAERNFQAAEGLKETGLEFRPNLHPLSCATQSAALTVFE